MCRAQSSKVKQKKKYQRRKKKEKQSSNWHCLQLGALSVRSKWDRTIFMTLISFEFFHTYTIRISGMANCYMPASWIRRNVRICVTNIMATKPHATNLRVSVANNLQLAFGFGNLMETLACVSKQNRKTFLANRSDPHTHTHTHTTHRLNHMRAVWGYLTWLLLLFFTETDTWLFIICAPFQSSRVFLFIFGAWDDFYTLLPFSLASRYIVPPIDHPYFGSNLIFARNSSAPGAASDSENKTEKDVAPEPNRPRGIE